MSPDTRTARRTSVKYDSVGGAGASPDSSPPPHDIDVERAVLGGILAHADHLAAPEVVSLSADSFYRIAHGQLFVALRELHREGRPLDVIT